MKRDACTPAAVTGIRPPRPPENSHNPVARMRPVAPRPAHSLGRVSPAVRTMSRGYHGCVFLAFHARAGAIQWHDKWFGAVPIRPIAGDGEGEIYGADDVDGDGALGTSGFRFPLSLAFS